MSGSVRFTAVSRRFLSSAESLNEDLSEALLLPHLCHFVPGGFSSWEGKGRGGHWVSALRG